MARSDVEDGMITKLSVQAIFFGSPTSSSPKIVWQLKPPNKRRTLTSSESRTPQTKDNTRIKGRERTVKHLVQKIKANRHTHDFPATAAAKA